METRPHIRTRTMDKVDATMTTITEQRELANEIAEAISGPMFTEQFDEVWLVLRTVVFSDILTVREGGAKGRIGRAGARPTQRTTERSRSCPCAYAGGVKSGRYALCDSIISVVSPSPSTETPAAAAVEDDEEAQLRELQAALSM